MLTLFPVLQVLWKKSKGSAPARIEYKEYVIDYLNYKI
jgi:hypothetical protein